MSIAMSALAALACASLVITEPIEGAVAAD